MVGGREWVAIALVASAATIPLWLWGLGDAWRTPREVWRAAGRHRAVWLVIQAVLLLPGTIAYAGFARPDLTRARRRATPSN